MAEAAESPLPTERRHLIIGDERRRDEAPRNVDRLRSLGNHPLCYAWGFHYHKYTTRCPKALFQAFKPLN